MQKKKRTLPQYGLLVSKGFCMGAADVVPGVSGGTMAFILGIYDELIDAIRSFNLKSLRFLVSLRFRPLLETVSWEFLLALGAGILLAVFSLAKALSWLLDNEPILIWSFFTGLILASVVTVSRRIQRWHWRIWVALAAGTLGLYWVVGLVPGATPEAHWFLFLSGAVAICAMILPGISGSFILVLMGKYQYVLDAVNERNFLVLLLVAAGAGFGIAAFSRVLGWLLRRFHDIMVAFLTGLMLGSLRKVWPWKETHEFILSSRGKMLPLIQSNVLPDSLGGETLAGIGLMALGFLVVLVLDHVAREQVTGT